MRKAIYLFLAGVYALTPSCSTDLDVLADWKETAVIYGILDQSDTAQYIRVNKAFLGEGNALTMAQVKDSINYSDVLKVRLERWRNGQMLESDTLERVTDIAKDPGVFASPEQVLYRFKKTLYEDSEYSLTVLNSSSGLAMTSKTSLVSDFFIDKPSPFTPAVSFTNPTVPYKVIWRTSEYGRLYDFVLRFHYTEIDLLASDTSSKAADIYFGSQKSRDLSGGETMEISFLGEFFYQSVSNQIPVKGNVKRKAGKLDFIFSVAADDFNTYLEVNKPSSGIAQERPEYTNIENGFGVFSARYSKSIDGIALNPASLDSLLQGQYTKDLSFE